jgi:perosamine synthetase
MSTRIPWWSPQIGPREYELVRQVLDSNYINEGEVTERFEKRIADLLGTKHAVAVTSGTAAITLALFGLGIGPGDEVVVPDMTFIATANAVTLAGAKPVLVDVDPATLSIDPTRFEQAIGPRTKAVVPVHVSGRAADMSAVGTIAAKHGLHVVEDAAEALMSRHHGHWLGTFGKAGCFSFSPNKTITTGQGGVVVTDDDSLEVRLRELKDQGRPIRGTGGDDVHKSVGFNFKLTNVQAAIGLAQLDYLEHRLSRLKAIYKIYSRRLRGVGDLRLFDVDVDNGESPQWVDALTCRRDDLARHLTAQGMGVRKFWYPIHTQAPYRGDDKDFPNSTRLAREAIWLPSAFTITDDDVAAVCDSVRAFFGENSR